MNSMNLRTECTNCFSFGNYFLTLDLEFDLSVGETFICDIDQLTKTLYKEALL